MKILAKTSHSDIATVYIAQMSNGKLVEFVQSTQPPIPLSKKWVLIISTMYGCPISCKFCDSGSNYSGKISKQDMFAQIDFLINSRFPDGRVPVEKFKIQFSRMGEPSLNMAVLDLLDEFDSRYDLPGFLPSLSTIAPAGRDDFFDRLIHIKNQHFFGRFQLQFSIHSSDYRQRDELIPCRKWDFPQIAEYGERFFESGDKKITLNFALADSAIIDPQLLRSYFKPEIFLIKLTPVNPTFKAHQNCICTENLDSEKVNNLIGEFRKLGFDVIKSIGEIEENKIGSNCGQFISNYMSNQNTLQDSYSYPLV